MKSYYIQLIRNGLTAGNIEGRYIGHIDEPLSKEGNEQIAQMKKDYKYPVNHYIRLQNILLLCRLLLCKNNKILRKRANYNNFLIKILNFAFYINKNMQ